MPQKSPQSLIRKLKLDCVHSSMKLFKPSRRYEIEFPINRTVYQIRPKLETHTRVNFQISKTLMISINPQHPEGYIC